MKTYDEFVIWCEAHGAVTNEEVDAQREIYVKFKCLICEKLKDQ